MSDPSWTGNYRLSSSAQTETNQSQQAQGDANASALQQLRASLQGTADERRADLQEAIRRVPHLVIKESDPVRFRTFSQEGHQGGFDERLAAYWTTRRKVFGERAFHAMIQTGSGALNPSEVQILRSCDQWKIIPSGSQGATVYFVDCSSSFNAPLEVQLRCLFYLLSVGAQNDASQKEGILLILSLPENIYSASVENAKTLIAYFLSLLHGSMPIRIKGVHVLAVSEHDISLQVRTFCESLDPSIRDCTTVHLKTTRQQILTDLKSIGLGPGAVPSIIGGDLKPRDVQKWHVDRARSEALSYNLKEPPRKHLAADEAPEELQVSSESSDPAAKPSSSSSSQTESGAPPADEKKRKDFLRKRNALYARRKYARKKIETEVLKEQCSRLETRNQELRVEQSRLETLVENANQMVRLCDTLMQTNPGIFFGQAAPAPPINVMPVPQAPPVNQLQPIAQNQAFNPSAQVQTTVVMPQGGVEQILTLLLSLVSHNQGTANTSAVASMPAPMQQQGPGTMNQFQAQPSTSFAPLNLSGMLQLPPVGAPSTNQTSFQVSGPATFPQQTNQVNQQAVSFSPPLQLQQWAQQMQQPPQVIQFTTHHQHHQHQHGSFTMQPQSHFSQANQSQNPNFQQPVGAPSMDILQEILRLQSQQQDPNADTNAAPP